jgi:hypothetical protein
MRKDFFLNNTYWREKYMKNKKLSKQELIELALEFPFYRWFYTEKADIDDLDKITYENAPILEKKFFFEYEKKCGEPYNTGIKECGETYSESTSGTTGRVLEMIRPYKSLKILYAAFGETLHKYLGKKPVILVQEYPAGSLNHLWIQFPKMKEYREVEDLIGVASIPCKDILDPDVISSHITTSGANVLFDPTGQWTQLLLEKDVPLKNLGIGAVMVVNPEPHIRNEIAKNFKLMGLYGGIDGCAAATCPHMKEPGYHPFKDYADAYVLEDGKIKEFGEGSLVVDKYNEQAFPFIKYMPHDMVKIEQKVCQCGEEKFLSMLGRVGREVRVPTQIDTIIRLDDVETVLSPEGRYLMVYTKIKSDTTDYGEHRILLSFVEKEDISHPQESKELSQKIADIHESDYIAYAVPVVLVPNGTFTHTQMKEQKLRNFFTAINTFPKEFFHLVDTAKEVGYEIITSLEEE